MTKEMFEEITAWQRKVFPTSTALSNVNHLNEEIRELKDALLDEDHLIDHEKRRAIIKEYADCFLLLFGSASLYGLGYDDICQAINQKMQINKQRKWGEVNAEGYVKHVD